MKRSTGLWHFYVHIAELHKIHRYPDLEPLKLWKGRSGKMMNLKRNLRPAESGQVKEIPDQISNFSFDESNTKTWGVLISHGSVRSGSICHCPLLPSTYYPTNPFTILKFPNPSQDVSELHKIRKSPDFEALNLWKGWSGREALYIFWPKSLISTLIFVIIVSFHSLACSNPPLISKARRHIFSIQNL